MKKPPISAWLVLLAIALLPLHLTALEKEDAYSVGCLPKNTSRAPWSSCAACHADNVSRWAAHQYRPCTPYCKSCHRPAEMERHHRVGMILPGAPDKSLKLTAKNEVACSTCHDLAQPRYDSVRWKAASLYDRMFRSEPRYKTYFLSKRNEQGQLCLSCH